MIKFTVCLRRIRLILLAFINWFNQRLAIIFIMRVFQLYWALTVMVPLGSGTPKGKNFTCNVFTISTHFSRRYRESRSLYQKRSTPQVYFNLEYYPQRILNFTKIAIIVTIQIDTAPSSSRFSNLTPISCWTIRNC